MANNELKHIKQCKVPKNILKIESQIKNYQFFFTKATRRLPEKFCYHILPKHLQGGGLCRPLPRGSSGSGATTEKSSLSFPPTWLLTKMVQVEGYLRLILMVGQTLVVKGTTKLLVVFTTWEGSALKGHKWAYFRVLSPHPSSSWLQSNLIPSPVAFLSI